MSNLMNEKEKLLEKKKKILRQMRAINEKERKIRARALIVFGAFCLEHFRDETFANFRNAVNNDLREKGIKDVDAIINTLQKEREKCKKTITKQQANSNNSNEMKPS